MVYDALPIMYHLGDEVHWFVYTAHRYQVCVCGNRVGAHTRGRLCVCLASACMVVYHVAHKHR